MNIATANGTDVPSWANSVCPIIAFNRCGDGVVAGTCFIIKLWKNQAVALTAKHVFKELIRLEGTRVLLSPERDCFICRRSSAWILAVHEGVGRPFEIKHAWIDRTAADLAVLRIALREDPFASGTPGVTLFRWGGPQIGEQVMVCGCPRGTFALSDEGAEVSMSGVIEWLGVTGTVVERFSAGEHHLVKGPSFKVQPDVLKTAHGSCHTRDRKAALLTATRREHLHWMVREGFMSADQLHTHERGKTAIDHRSLTDGKDNNVDAFLATSKLVTAAQFGSDAVVLALGEWVKAERDRGLAIETVNKKLWSVQRFGKWLWEKGYISVNATLRVQPVRARRGENIRKMPHRALTPAQGELLFAGTMGLFYRIPMLDGSTWL